MSASSFEEKSLCFIFEDGEVCKLDREGGYYRRHFHGNLNPAKCADFAFLDACGCLWIIEVKDFRKTSKSEDHLNLGTEVAIKFRDTMAMLFALAHKKFDGDNLFARHALKCKEIQFVFHVEGMCKTHSGMKESSAIQFMANLRSRLRQLKKWCGSSVLVVSKDIPAKQQLRWKVESLPMNPK